MPRNCGQMRFRLPQTVVYWAPKAAGTYGRPSLATPVELAARWEDKQEQTIDGNGDVASSSATVFLAVPVLTGGAMLLGDLSDLGSGFPTNPKDDPRCHEIISVSVIPSLNASQSLTTAYLK